jgi:hypothetical protein
MDFNAAIADIYLRWSISEMLDPPYLQYQFRKVHVHSSALY